MKRCWLLLFLGVIAGGCVSTMSGSEAVRTVTDANDVKTCSRLAAVESTSLWGGESGRESNKNTMRRETGARGGGTLLLGSRKGKPMPHSTRETYRCSQNAQERGALPGRGTPPSPHRGRD